MTTADTPDLELSTILARIDEGSLPKDFTLLAARGLLPLEQESLVAVVTRLTTNEDAEVRESAKSSLADFPSRVVLAYARSTNAHPEDLDRLAAQLDDPLITEAILRNRVTNDPTFAKLASRVAPNLQEVIVVNQERILRTPAILDALLENPGLSPDVRRRALETREEFFIKRPARVELPPDVDFEEPQSEEENKLLDDLLAEAALLDESGELPPAIPPEGIDGEDEKKQSLWSKISKMNVSQKVQLAFKGGTTERSILVRERNKLISGAVIRNPRITENEIEMFAGMRNLDDEVLRLIGNNRQWMQKYPIMLSLVRNPKAPIGIVLPLINRLNLRDLKGLGGDKGVTETVRASARRLYLQKRQSG
jgi:hypothetical protein